MPKEHIDYSNTIIYKIYCKDSNITDFYVGHTTNFIKRKSLHKSSCLNQNNQLKIYEIIRTNGGWNNWNMIEIAKYNCKDVIEARIKQQYHYSELKTSLNNISSSIEINDYCCENDEKNAKKIYCENCNKIFSHRQSLHVHKKRCIMKEDNELYDNTSNNNIINTNNNIVNTNNMVYDQNSNDNVNVLMEVIKQNQEFQKFMMEQMVEISRNCNTTNNINSHNKTFNLQVFLNEKCKDAMNIDEFVDSLKLTFNDLESVGELGFVKGISRIFINGLKQLDVYKRPIHCSDLKREVIHLKDAGVWEKDNENKDIMKKLVKMIANKNIDKIYEWREAYPNHRYSDDPKNDIYLKIAYQSMGAKSKEDDIAFYEKIIKNVAKEVTINKIN